MRGMGAFPKPRMSVEEYLELDRHSEVPLEYHDGEVFPIGWDGLWHGNIILNVSGALVTRLEGKPCRPTTTARVCPRERKYVYPDLMVYCGKAQFLPDGESVGNPTIIFEILSRATRNYDYGEKFILYRKLRTLREYVLIAQDQPLIETYRFSEDGSWRLTSDSGLTAEVALHSVGVSLPFSEIYKDVEFPLSEEVPS